MSGPGPMHAAIERLWVMARDRAVSCRNQAAQPALKPRAIARYEALARYYDELAIELNWALEYARSAQVLRS